MKPPDVVALADGEGNDHPCVDVALRLIRLLLMKRYRNEGSQYECVDALSPAPKQLGVAAGHRGQEDIVDLGVVGVRDCFEVVEVGADDRQPAIRADSTVDARSRRAPLGEDLACRRPGPLHATHRRDRRHDGGQHSVEPGDPSAHVVLEEFAGGRRRRSGPRPRTLLW